MPLFFCSYHTWRPWGLISAKVYDDHRKAIKQPTLEEETKRPPYDTARQPKQKRRSRTLNNKNQPPPPPSTATPSATPFLCLSIPMKNTILFDSFSDLRERMSYLQCN